MHSFLTGISRNAGRLSVYEMQYQACHGRKEGCVIALFLEAHTPVGLGFVEVSNTLSFNQNENLHTPQGTVTFKQTLIGKLLIGLT